MEKEEKGTDIQPEDLLRILLPAKNIPDKSTVTKRTGDQEFTLSRSLKVYSEPEKKVKKEPLVIDGLFLLGHRGGINQINPETVLCWIISAEDLVEELRFDWDGGYCPQ